MEYKKIENSYEQQKIRNNTKDFRMYTVDNDKIRKM